YIEAIEILEDGDGVHGYELNISCPNVKAGGESFANDARQAAAVTQAVKRAATRPVIVKLSPNATHVAALARAVQAAGADPPAPRRCRWSPRGSGWRLTSTRAGPAWPTSRAACRARRSSRSRCAASSRLRARSRFR